MAGSYTIAGKVIPNYKVKYINNIATRKSVKIDVTFKKIYTKKNFC